MSRQNKRERRVWERDKENKLTLSLMYGGRHFRLASSSVIDADNGSDYSRLAYHSFDYHLIEKNTQDDCEHSSVNLLHDWNY